VRVRDILTTNVVHIRAGATLREAAQLVSWSQASDLAVVDDGERFVGVLSEGDLIRAVMPRFDEIVASSGSLAEAFELFVAGGKDLAGQPVDRLVIRDPITVSPDDDVLKAATVMVTKQIRRLPVVEDGRVVGTVSRAHVCKGVFAAAGR
jgi:CBS domain-containing protein